MTVQPIYSLKGKRILVAGHRGLVGSAVVRRLLSEPCSLLTAGRAELDLRRQSQVEDWIRKEKPDAIIVAAATVGGIVANDSRPAEFLYDNATIALNIAEASYRSGVEKLLFLGASCVYPRLAAQPMREDDLLTGPLEPTNQWYAIAKIAGLMLCRAYRRQHGCDFISAMPTSLYGPFDNFDLEGGHVIPALIAKAHAAKLERRDEMIVWGSGTPRREFMHVDDCADALVFLLQHYSGEEHVNVGIGSDVSIGELAETVARIVGFEGRLRFDLSKPDGMPRKLLDSTRLGKLGWTPKIKLEDGLRDVYAWFCRQENGQIIRKGN